MSKPPHKKWYLTARANKTDQLDWFWATHGHERSYVGTSDWNERFVEVERTQDGKTETVLQREPIPGWSTLPKACMDTFEIIQRANPHRHSGNIERRALKLAEEAGEVAQAVLAVTSADNRKGKTWADVREECCDCVIVAVDIALTLMADQQGMDPAGQLLVLQLELARKLDAWAAKRARHSDNSDVT